MNGQKTLPAAPSKGWRKITQVCFLLSVFGILLSLSLLLNNRLFGEKIGEPKVAEAADSTMTVAPDGLITVRTDKIGASIEGYAGAVPLEILIREGKIQEIKALPNAETPDFFDRAFSGIAPKYKGKTLAEALDSEVDAVSGATFSSDAIIENVDVALEYVLKHEQAVTAPAAEKSGESPLANPGWWCAIAVALCAAFLPFFVHNHTYRIIQLAANVGVLGFWTGTFLSYTVIFSLLSGTPRLAMLPAWILVAIAFVLPLFAGGNRYCSWVCPFGSLQELAGMCRLPKIHLPAPAVKALTWFRRILWIVLMMLLWTFAFTQWIDYEIFTAFVVVSAPTVILWVAGAFVLLSLFIERPFCRFVCPLGTIINLSERKLP